MKNITEKYFNIRNNNSATILELDYMIFLEDETYSHKEKLGHILKEIEGDTNTDVLIISNNHPDFSMEKYSEKWDKLYNNKLWESNIIRIFRTYDDIFIKIKSLKKAIVFMNYKAVNSMLFNFSFAADLRFISSDFVVDNNNINMLNIPKGASVLNSSSSTYKNPFKLMFLLEKITANTLYKRHLADRIYENNMEAETLKVAEHLATFDYIELETIKIIDQNKLSDTELKLQRENEFLLSCIRTKVNQK